jgi:hypothetical protein
MRASSGSSRTEERYDGCLDPAPEARTAMVPRRVEFVSDHPSSTDRRAHHLEPVARAARDATPPKTGDLSVDQVITPLSPHARSGASRRPAAHKGTQTTRVSVRWPRLLSEEDAAEYVGVSQAQFRMEVKKGIWPKPVPRGCRRNTYDRSALDKAADRLSGMAEVGEDDLIRGARAWGRSE